MNAPKENPLSETHSLRTIVPTFEQKSLIWSSLGYIPSPEQELIHRDLSRQLLVSGGWQAGKSYLGAKEVIAQAFFGDLVWLVGPDYEQCKREWDYIVADALTLGVLNPSNISDPVKGPRSMVLTFPGGYICKIQTKSAKDPVTLGSYAPNLILGCEFAQAEWDAYVNLLGRTAPRRGRFIMTGTFEDSRGWYNDMFETWQGDNDDGAHSYSLPSWSNRVLYPGGRNDPEIKRMENTLTPDKFKEKIGGEPARLRTLVFPEFDPKLHVKEFDFNKDYPVQIAVDPGYAHHYAVLFIQEYDNALWVFDEIYVQGKKSVDVCQMVRAMSYFGSISGGVIDVAGNQHNAVDSHVEIWQAETGLYLRSRKIPVLDGIDRYRTFLHNPSTGQPRIFWSTNCPGGIEEHSLYKYRKPKEDHPIREEPIDRNNDAMKAICYYCIDRFGYVDRIAVERKPLYYRTANPWSRMAGRT